jgi:uncharacterized glyoxalase superfamily protein PhnB
MPFLVVRDADAALAFYQKAFGLAKRMVMPGPDGKALHVEVSWHDAVIMLGREQATPKSPHRAPVTTGVPPAVGLYLYCDDVDALFDRATAAGAKGVQPPTDMFWGDRMCTVTDPDGHSWSFATNVADFDPSKAPS